MTSPTRAYPSHAYGDVSRPLSYERQIVGTSTYISWASAAIQILTSKDGTPLSTFSSPLAVTTGLNASHQIVALASAPTKPAWQPVFGTAAGQIPPISGHTTLYVRWTGVDADGNAIVAELIEWPLKVR